MVVINLDEYRKARKARARVAAASQCREEELLCVNWSGASAVSAMFCYRRPEELGPPLPDNLAAIDADAFIERLHGLAAQI